MPLKILLVDDEEDILWGLSEELSRHGWEILTASSGTEAIQILQSVKDLDFLITDVRMPDISGIDLLLKARELQPQIRAIVMTAHGNEELRNEAFQRGAISYLEKPFDFDQLLTVIQEMEDEGAAGTLQEWNLMDVLQLVAMEGRSARFSVNTPDGPGVLWVKDGELWFAQLGNYEGEEAFFHILRHENVEFQMEWVDTVDVPRNIQQPLYALLLEVVRMRNEARTEDLGRLESELLGEATASPAGEGAEALPSLEDISLEGLGELPQEPKTEEPELPALELPEEDTGVAGIEEEEPAAIGEFSVDEVMAEESEDLPSLDEISLDDLDQEPVAEEPETPALELPEEAPEAPAEVVEAESTEAPPAPSAPSEGEIPPPPAEEAVEELEELPDLPAEEDARVMQEVEALEQRAPQEMQEVLSPALEEELQEILEEDRQETEPGGVEIEEAPSYVAQETPVQPEAPPEPTPPAPEEAPSPEGPAVSGPPRGERDSGEASASPALAESDADALKELMKRFAKSTGVTGIHALVDRQGRLAIGAVKGQDLQRAFQQWIQDIVALIQTGDLGDLEDFALTTGRYHLLGARVGPWIYVAMFPRAGVNIGMARVRFQSVVKEMRKQVG